jgi:hypothetical protein
MALRPIDIRRGAVEVSRVAAAAVVCRSSHEVEAGGRDILDAETF